MLAPVAHAQSLQTVAERTEYKATSKYADVVAFCEAIAKRGPNAKLSYFGTSQEGRKLPLLVVSDPPVASAEEATKAGKVVVLVFANIHAGEVDGKEAVLAIARDLSEKKGHFLLKDLVILLAPIFNADGNEKFATTNRPGQNGPMETGIRANAQGFDLNRDFVKLESPEVRALVKLLNVWDPAMVIDCHTTNGSKHRYTLTYDGPRYPTTETAPAEWASTVLFPEVARKVKATTGFDIAPYGNFNIDRTKWETYPSTPRFGVQYFALRGKIGVLSESYTYASFADRVKASYAFVTACLEVAAEKHADLAKAATPLPTKRIELRTRTEAFPEKVSIKGFEEETRGGKRVATQRPKEYPLDYVGRVTAVEAVELPFAYLFGPANTSVVENLQRHGIKVEEIREDIDLHVEAYRAASVETSPRAFQKHHLTTIEVSKQSESRRIPAGTMIVRTAQPLGPLAGYLLEPRSEDGLAAWGFFNDQLKPGSEFPVLRLQKSYPLAAGDASP
ncbi:MAG TPA: M14 family metallopeptidase, partial [Gemmata sp.]|nr:M14 family metallopeptidase [Gemmata sp.]